MSKINVQTLNEQILFVFLLSFVPESSSDVTILILAFRRSFYSIIKTNLFDSPVNAVATIDNFYRLANELVLFKYEIKGFSSSAFCDECPGYCNERG